MNLSLKMLYALVWFKLMKMTQTYYWWQIRYEIWKLKGVFVSYFANFASTASRKKCLLDRSIITWNKKINVGLKREYIQYKILLWWYDQYFGYLLKIDKMLIQNGRWNVTLWKMSPTIILRTIVPYLLIYRSKIYPVFLGKLIVPNTFPRY